MPNILVFCAANIPAVTVAVMDPLRALIAQTKKHSEAETVQLFYKNTEDLVLSDFIRADTIICVRGSDPIELAIIEEAKKAGKYTVYFLDDNLLDLPPESDSRAYFQNKIPRKTLRRLIETVDCLWTDNPNIQKLYEPDGKKTAILDLMIAPKKEPKRQASIQEIRQKRECLKIGFAGCIDHEIYLSRILPDVIHDLKERYSESVEFELFGARPQIIEQFALRHIPYQENYDDYVQTMKRLDWDIAIAPLPDTPFHRCKYFNKFLEYASFGIPAVYSEVEPYTFVIRNEENGLYAGEDAKSWIQALTRLIEDAELRADIATKAFTQLQEEFSEHAVAEKIHRQIPALTTHQAPPMSPKDRQAIAKILKEDHSNTPMARTIHKIRRIIRIHRARAPWYVLTKATAKIKRKLRASK